MCASITNLLGNIFIWCDYTMNYNRQYKTLFYFYTQKTTTFSLFFLVVLICCPVVVPVYHRAPESTAREWEGKTKKVAEMMKLKNYD